MAIIYIVTDNNIPSWETRSKVLEGRFKSFGYEVQITKASDVCKIILDDNALIATNIDYQYSIFKNRCNFGNIYNLWNDKIAFYNYLKQNDDLLDGLQLIPHYDSSYKGPNITKEFFLKEKDGWSSKFNQKIHGNIYNLIAMYGKKNQIQDVMIIKHIYGVSVSSLHGKIIGIYTYLTNEGLTPEMNASGFNAIRSNYIKYEKVKNFIINIIKKVSFNGIVEFEFIIDNNDIIYVMESNPRLSGSLRVQFYFDWVVVPYIKAMHNNNFIEWDFNDKSKWKTY
jgi:hypothetical protein